MDLDPPAADRDAFLRAILAAPADDLPRLTFADWLDEHGEGERAEFVRVQCKLAELNYRIARGGPFPRTGPVEFAEGERWARRERELWMTRGWYTLPRELHRHWSAHIDQTLPGASYDRISVVRRGFLAEVRCDWPAWRDHGDAIRRAQPVEKVVLTTPPELDWLRQDSLRDGSGPVVTQFRLAGERPVITTDLPRTGMGFEPLDAAAIIAARWPAVPGELGPVAFELPPEPAIDGRVWLRAGGVDWARYTEIMRGYQQSYRPPGYLDFDVI